MHRKAFLALAIVCCLSTAAFAQTATISIGNYIVPAGPGQVIEILVSGDALFGGADLNLTIGDGLSGPVITGVDMIGAGLLFNGNNTGQSSSPLSDWEFLAGTTTGTGEVGPTGTLGRMTLDTSGLLPGSTYDLFLNWLGIPSAVSSQNGEIENILIDGSLTIEQVPEPSSIVLGGLAALGLGIVAIRRRKAAK